MTVTTADAAGVTVGIDDPVICRSHLTVTYELAAASDPDNFEPLDSNGFTSQITNAGVAETYILRRMVDAIQLGPSAEAEYTTSG